MTKSKRWLCKLIVLFILLVGMCDEKVKADSLFLCSYDMADDQVSNTVLSEGKVETMELFCVRTAITGNQIIMQLANGRKTIKLSMIFLCIVVYWLLLSNFYRVERIAEFPQLSIRTTVLMYIHNTDGKK